jgi:hypothetical protein
MRLIILSCIALFAGGLNAQITITAADLQNANENYPVANANMVNSFDFTMTGADFTWDYSEMEPASTDTTKFVTVEGAPFFYQFLFNSPFDPEHDADFATTMPDIDIAGMITMEDLYQFYQKNDEHYTAVGTGTTINGVPLPSTNNPVDRIYSLPLNYTDMDSSYSEWSIAIPTLGSYKLKQWRNYEVDGWGTLITPYGEFETIRVKMELEMLDSIYVDALGFGFETPRSSVEYHWLGLEGGIPLLQVTSNFDIATGIVYQFADGSKPTAINEWDANDLVIYPNPVKNRLWIDMPSKMRELTTAVTLVDMNGKEVKRFSASAIDNALDLKSLAAGRYTLLFFNEDILLSDHAILVD